MGVGAREFQQAVENGDPFLKASLSRPRVTTRLPSCNVVRHDGKILPVPASPPQDTQVFDSLADQYLLCFFENGKPRCKSKGLKLQPNDERVVCGVLRRAKLNCDENRDGWSPLSGRTRALSITNSNVSSPGGGLSPPSRGKRRRSLPRDVTAYGQPTTRPLPPRIMMGADDESSDADEIMPVDCGPETKVYFRVDEATRIKGYMGEALKAMQQRNCKLICKTWIQAFEPSKQTKFPYNATKKNDENRLSCRPEIPYWWPPNIPHTEPDHLRLSDRVPLLLHMVYCRERLRSRHEELMAREAEIKAMDPNDPQAQVLTEELERLSIVRNFRAKDFLKFARQAAHRFEPPEAFVCVEEMFRLREYQERHEAGGMDGAASISARSTDHMKNMIKEANRSKKGVARTQTGPTSPSVTNGPNGRHTRSTSPSPVRIVPYDDAYKFPEAHSPKKLRSQSSHNIDSDFAPKRPSPTKCPATMCPDLNANSNSSFWPRQPQPQLPKEIFSSYGSRLGLYDVTPHEINDIYPRADYGFIQSHDAQYLITQPEDSPSLVKWSPAEPDVYISPDYQYRGPPAHSNPPPIAIQPMYLSEPMTELDSSASTSFATGYNSEPQFRTGPLCHPDPRTDTGDGRCDICTFLQNHSTNLTLTPYTEPQPPETLP